MRIERDIFIVLFIYASISFSHTNKKISTENVPEHHICTFKSFMPSKCKLKFHRSIGWGEGRDLSSIIFVYWQRIIAFRIPDHSDLVKEWLYIQMLDFWELHIFNLKNFVMRNIFEITIFPLQVYVVAKIYSFPWIKWPLTSVNIFN